MHFKVFYLHYITYKIAVLTYNVLHGTYLDPLVQTDEPYAVMPPARLFTVGIRAFAVAEPAVWNSLPYEHLGGGGLPQTHLFAEAYRKCCHHLLPVGCKLSLKPDVMVF